MRWSPDGNKHYSSALEAVMFLRESTRGIVRWLHECRENGGRMLHFPQYRSLLNDIANVTVRFVTEQERTITDLQERLHQAESARCPRCGATRQEKKE